MGYRVCIPTAGTGSRLGDLTKYVNKSLVSITNRPTICHIIEKFPNDTEFVLALGHKGDLVRDFVGLAYPSRTFYFADVQPFEGPDSGLGLSLLACQDYLQQPFIFISCDTLVEEDIPAPDVNWIAYADVADLNPYRTLLIDDNNVADICEKGIGKPRSHKAYIGLAGINDYETFWNAMSQGSDVAIHTGEVHGLRKLLHPVMSAHKFTWFDTGNLAALEHARAIYREPHAPNILDKSNEAIWFVDNQVIKFSDDQTFIANRVRRVEELRGYVPEISGSAANMYRYEKIDGMVMSEVVSIPLFADLLDHCDTFWSKKSLVASEASEFRNRCLAFYQTKTLERIELFYRNFSLKDGIEPINSQSMPTLESLLNNLDWNWLADGVPGRFHGDLHFENILWDTNEDHFTFLDWRQDFGGDLSTGDIYYDFAKLLHGLIISHELIAGDFYKAEWDHDEITYDFHRKQILVECEEYFKSWLEAQGYDTRKVWVLTALIFLNIAPLHHFPYSLLLFALGKSMLNKELSDSK